MTDTPTLKIEGVRYIVTMDPERRIVTDGSVVITGNRISQVGKSAELADSVAGQTIDGSGIGPDARVRQRPHAHQLCPRGARSVS